MDVIKLPCRQIEALSIINNNPNFKWAEFYDKSGWNSSIINSALEGLKNKELLKTTSFPPTFTERGKSFLNNVDLTITSTLTVAPSGSICVLRGNVKFSGDVEFIGKNTFVAKSDVTIAATTGCASVFVCFTTSTISNFGYTPGTYCAFNTR